MLCCRLISTDALARGIDIVDCDSVISYDPPKNVKTYIHRIGRTGRAGRHGTAFAILTQTQQKQFKVNIYCCLQLLLKMYILYIHV